MDIMEQGIGGFIAGIVATLFVIWLFASANKAGIEQGLGCSEIKCEWECAEKK